MSILLFSVLLAGETVSFGDDFTTDEYVEFLNGSANPSLSLECKFWDKQGRSFRAKFAQTGGYVFLEGGYDSSDHNYTIGKTPVVTTVIVDDAGVFTTSEMPSLWDSQISGKPVRFKTADGYTYTKIEYIPRFFDGPFVVDASTSPPPLRSPDESENGEIEKYIAEVFERRPQELVGFCDKDQAIQAPLTFEQYEQLAAEGTE